MFLLMISFIVALALVLVAMPKVIPYLHKLKFGQVEREEGLASHKKTFTRPVFQVIGREAGKAFSFYRTSSAVSIILAFVKHYVRVGNRQIV